MCVIQFNVNYFFNSSTATATLKYRASLNNTPHEPSSVPSSTGNVPILCHYYRMSVVMPVQMIVYQQ